MPQFIHLSDERNLKMILKNGIKSHHFHGTKKKGVFATPVLRDYYLSHQWLRELKRRGMRSMSAVQFRVDDDTPVSVGRYNKDHIVTTAAEAVRIFMEHDTGMGLQVIIPGSIPAKAITRTYAPNKVSGWRYYPESHSDGRKPCGCPFCQRGQIKNRLLRLGYDKEIGLD